jgi:hypothetical protein
VSQTFDPNDRAAILAALADPDPSNPIARAVAERVEALAGALKDATEKAGGLPRRIEIGKPRTALDEIAVQLFERTLADMPGAPVVVVTDHGRQ